MACFFFIPPQSSIFPTRYVIRNWKNDKKNNFFFSSSKNTQFYYSCTTFWSIYFFFFFLLFKFFRYNTLLYVVFAVERREIRTIWNSEYACGTMLRGIIRGWKRQESLFIQNRIARVIVFLHIPTDTYAILHDRGM